MYAQIYNRLSQAKESGQQDAIKSALMFFITKLNTMVDSFDGELKDTLVFSDFIQDPDFIFGVDNLSIFNKRKPDLNISTNGLAVELFKMGGIADGEKLIAELKDAIFVLHAKDSKGILDNELEISKLRSVLEKIKNKIS